MDKVYTETSEENDYTDHRIKKRISSILKAPRTPLRDLGSGNELTQECNNEKHQKNSRRVSFAETIRVFPTDPQTTVELNPTETAAEAEYPVAFNQNEEQGDVPCELTGRNTLFHAPIQTSLQQIKCHNANTIQEWNKMEKTLIFLEENEMDMTAGHTVMITHDIGLCQETLKPSNIDCKLFSAELKSNKISEMNTEFSCFSMKMNDACDSQQQSNTEHVRKVNFGEFLKSMKATKPSAEGSFVPSEVPEREMCSSEENPCLHVQANKGSMTAIIGGVDNSTDVTQCCISNETTTIIASTCHASKQLGHGETTMNCGVKNMDMNVSNSFNMTNPPPKLGSDYTITYEADVSRLNTVPQDSTMCIKELRNNKEADTAKKSAIKITPRNASMASKQEGSTKTVMSGTLTSMPLLHSDKTNCSSFYAEMEMTGNCTGLNCDEDFGKQSNNVSRKMERTVFGQDNMDITITQAANINLTSVQHSIPYNEMTTPSQKSTYGTTGLLKSRIYPVSETSCFQNKEGNPLPHKSAVFSATNLALNRSHVAGSDVKQADRWWLPPSNDTTNLVQRGRTAIDSKLNRKCDSSTNATSVIPEDKTVADMELTKPISYLVDNSWETAGFQDVQQQKMEAGTKSTPDSATAKTVVFSPSEEHDMEMTKSHTVAVNYGLTQHCESTPQALSLRPLDKTVVYAYNDMDETKPVVRVIDQSQNPRPQTLQKRGKETGKTHTGSTNDKTIVFSLSRDIEMEITRSHTVALKHNAVPQVEDLSVVSLVPANKSVMWTFNDNMEITNSVACVNDKALKSVLGSLATPQPNIKTNMKRVPEPACDKTVMFSLSKEDEMEFTKSLTVPINHDISQQVEGLPQVLSLIPAKKTNVPLLMTKPSTLMPAEKTVVLMHNTDREITKSVMNMPDASLKNTRFKALPQREKVTGKDILSESAKEETTKCLLPEDNEMEITRSHTVTVNHEDFAETYANKSSMPIHGSCITKSTSFIPADTSVIGLHNNNKDLTKPITDVFLNNTVLLQTVKETSKTNDIVDLVLHNNEMEISKSHTVADNHDIVSQCKRTPPVLFYQDDMGITESHSITKNTRENMHTNVLSLEKQVKGKISSNPKLLATVNDTEIAKRHAMSFDNETVQQQPTNQSEKTESPMICSFTCYQEGPEVTNFIDNGRLGESEKQNRASKNLPLNLANISSSTYVDKSQDIEGAKNHTIIYHDPDNYVPSAEKQTPNSPVNSRDKTAPLLDDEKMEMTRNYTTGIEFIQRNDFKNECYSLATKENASNVMYSRKENECILSVEIPNPKLCEEIVPDLYSESRRMLDTESKTLPVDSGQLCSSTEEHNPSQRTGLPMVDRTAKKYETVSYELGNMAKDRQMNLNFLGIDNLPLEEEPGLLPEQSGIVNDCSKLKDIEKMSECVLLPQDFKTSLGEELPKLIMKPEDPLGVKDAKESSIPIASNEMTNTVPLNIIYKNGCHISKLPLHVFQPKLPNKRQPTNVKNAGDGSKERTETQDSENVLLIQKYSDKITQDLSPSHYIDEEQLPTYVDTMDSSRSPIYELPEKAYEMINEKELIDNERSLSEELKTDRQKRPWDQEGADLQKEKKLKIDEDWNDISELKQPLSSTMVVNSHAETHGGKNVPKRVAMNLERTQINSSSSLDSMKSDTDLSIQRNSAMETHLLMDSNCEQHLREKLQEGVITVREFLTLLQVHVLIQKPRQSQLPLKYAVSTAVTPEDLVLSQYIYRPKLQIYDEDCQLLSEIIDELKLRAGDQDKRLVNVHKSLWEVMRTCSDVELRGFGTELNKMKSYFTKKSKVLAHKEKTKLYAKLVQNAKSQWEKLQSRLVKVDELLKEMDSCLLALETETAKLVESELDSGDSVAEYQSKLRETQRELENHRAQEEALQRDLSNINIQKQQMISEISQLQEDEKNSQELMKKHKFSVWMMKEWNEHQAVFTFLYDSIELTVALGCPVDDVKFSKKFCRKITGVNFASLLDETNAPPSIRLVQRLIFQFINSERLRQEECLTMHHLYQMLHDLSLVVRRCQSLGEEIEYLNRWGGKYSLLNIEVNDTILKLLFSSSVAFAKFEVEFSLSASYPSSPMTFTVQKCIGNLGQGDISLVLSSVPTGANYLKRMVHQIHHTLLQNASTSTKSKTIMRSSQMGETGF